MDATAGLGAFVAAAVLVAATGCGHSSTAATAPAASAPASTVPAATSSTSFGACPSAAVVDAALALHDGAPVVTTTPFSKTCTYPGAGALSSTKITFQQDSAAQFAVDEKAAGSFGSRIVKVNGLGQAAWTTGTGDLYVYDGHEQIKILALAVGVAAPSTATAKVEVLARKLL